MIVCDHNIPAYTLSDEVTLRVFDDKDDFEALLFLVVAAIACDSGGERTCALREIDDFGTVENYYFLVFVGRYGGRGRRTFVGFTFVVLFAEGSFALCK